MKGYTEIDGKIYISSSRAHEISGYSKDYIGQLSRAKKIEARMIGRSWYINEDSLLKHKKEAEALAELRNQEYAAQSARAKLTLNAPKEPVQVYDARQMIEAVSPAVPATPAASAVLIAPVAPAAASIPPISWNISYSADERPLLPTLQKKIVATGPTSPATPSPTSPLASVKSPFMKDLHQIAATAAMITVLGIGAVYAMHPDMVTASLAAAARQIVATAVGLTHSTEEATVAARSQFSGARVTLATASVGDLFKYIFGSDGSSTNSGNSGYINRGAPITDMERYPYYIGGLTTSNFATTPENVIYPGITGTSTAASAAATASAGSTKTGTRVAAAASSLKSQMSLADIDAHIEEVLSHFVPWRPTYTFISGQSINDATLTGAAIGPSINAAITGGTTAFSGASLSISGQATVGSINVNGGINSGGPVNISSGVNLLLSTDSSGNVVATTSPSVAAIFATSTTATSVFAGNLNVNGNSNIGGTLAVTGTTTIQSILGIGTSTPAATFGIQGNAFISGDIASVANITATGTLRVAGNTIFGGTITNTNTGTSTYAGDVLARSVSAWQYLNTPFIQATSTSATSTFAGGLSVAGANGLTVQQGSGWTGIGTTTPSTNFAVQGSGLFSGDISAANIVATGTISVPSFVLNGASPNTVLATDASGHIVSTSTVTANNFWATSSSAVNYFAGNVGIGTTSPAANLAVQGAAYVSGNLTVGGNTITLGNSTSNTLTINSAITSDIIPNQNNTYKLGSPSFYWQDLYINNVHANNISAASTTIGGTTDNNFIINSDNASADAESATLVFNRGTVVPNAVIEWDATNKQFNLNQSTFIQNASTNQLALPTLSLKGEASQTGDLFQIASSSGAYVLNVTADGRVGIGSTSPSQLLGVQGSALVSGDVTAANFMATGTVQAAGSIVSNSGYVQSVSGIFRGDDQYHQIIFHNGTNSTDYIEWGDTLANGGGHRFYTGGASPTLRMEIADNGTYMQGPVGIGTTSPSQALSIQGNGLFSGDLSAANITATGTATLANAVIANLTVSGGTSYTGTGTTTFAGDILARGISAWQYLNAPFIQATSTTATSTFAGGLSVAGANGLTVQQGSGWVGIGTSSPAAALALGDNSGTAAGGLKLGNDVSLYRGAASQLRLQGNTGGFLMALQSNPYFQNNAGGAFFQLLDSGSMSLNAGGTNQNITLVPSGTGNTIVSTGNVGIGSSSPTDKLVVTTATKNGGIIVQDTPGNNGSGGGVTFAGTFGAFNNLAKIYAADTNGGPGTVAGDLRFQTASGSALADRMTLTSAGNLGIGSTSPSQLLGVQGNALISGNITSVANITATGTLTVAGNATFGGTSLAGNDASGSFDFFANRNDTSHSATYGYKTGGTLNWYNGLRGLANNNWYLYNNNTGMNTITADYNTDLVTINSSLTAGNTITASNFVGTSSANSTFAGKVGIGTTSPSAFLTVGANSANALDGNELFQFANTANTTAYGTIRGSGSTVYLGTNSGTGFIGTFTSNNFALRVNGNDKVTVTSAGSVGIGTTSPNIRGFGGPVLTVGSSGASDTAIELARSVSGSDGTVGNLAFINTAAGAETRAAAILGLRSGADNSGALAFWTQNAGSWGERVRLSPSGSLGIGTTTPGQTLSLNGTSYFTSSGNGTKYQFDVTGSNGTQTPFLFEADNNFSLGLCRTLGAAGSGCGKLQVTTGGALNMMADNVVALSPSNTQALIAHTNGDVGIGSMAGNTLQNLFTVAGSTAIGSGYAATAAPANGLIVQGNVGIGTTTPASLLTLGTQSGNATLTIDGFNQPVIDLKKNNILKWELYDEAATDNLTFRNVTGSANAMVINTSGNVGIGTTSPYAKLAVKGSTATASTINFQTTNNSDVPLFTVRDDGFVGIGSASPSHELTLQGDNTNIGVNDNNGQFVIRGATDTNKRLVLGYQTTGNYGWIQSGQNGTGNTALNLNPNGGNVGIGTTSPASKFSVSGNAYISGSLGVGTSNPNGYAFNWYSPTYGNGFLDFASNPSGVAIGSTDANLSLWAGGAVKETILTNGNVGIGSTSPTNLLVVGSGTGASLGALANNSLYPGILLAPNSANAQLTIGTTGNIQAGFLVDNGGKAYVGTWTNNNFVLRTNNSDRVTVDTNGNVGVGTTSPSQLLSVASGPGSVSAYFAGRVGIGTSNPGDALAVSGGAVDINNGDGVNVTRFNYNNGSTNYIRGTTFFDQAPAYFTGGNVGIGTSTPNAKLEVFAGSGNGGDLQVSGDVNNTFLDASKGLIFRTGKWNGTFNTGAALDSSGNMFLGYSGGGLTVGQSYNATTPPANGAIIQGNVGIGTTSPAGVLTVKTNSATPVFYLDNNLAGGRPWSIDPYISGVNNAGFQIKDQFAGASRLVIDTSGNVGISTSTPATKLDVFSSTAGPQAVVESNGGFVGLSLRSTTSGVFQNWQLVSGVNNSTQNFALEDVTGGRTSTQAPIIVNQGTNGNIILDVAGGNVGIGTSGPTAPLHVVSADATNMNKQVAIFDHTQPGGGGSSMITLLTATHRGDFEQNGGSGTFRYGTYTDTNIVNNEQSSSGAYGNINFVTGNGSGSGIAMTIGGGTNKGNVGIGTTSPASLFSVGGNATQSQGFYVDSNGVLGIGDSNPSATAQRLHISGSATQSTGSVSGMVIDTSLTSTKAASTAWILGLDVKGTYNTSVTSGNTLSTMAALRVGSGATIANLSNGTINTAAGADFEVPTLTAGSGAILKGATVYIAGAPSGANNNFALYSSSGTNYFGGNVNLGGTLGIGTTTPTSNLVIAGSSPVLQMYDTSQTMPAGLYNIQDASDKLSVYRGVLGVSANERMRLDNAGLVTTAGGLAIDATSGGNFTGTHSVYIPNSGTGYFNNGSGFSFGTTTAYQQVNIVNGGGNALSITGQGGARYIMMGNQDSAGVGTPSMIGAANGALMFGHGSDWTNSVGGTFTQNVTLTSGGNFGIGNTNPLYKLSLQDSSAVLEEFKVGSTAFGYMGSAGSLFSSQSATDLGIYGNGHNVMIGGRASPDLFVSTSGNVGIGTTSPSQTLSVQGKGLFSGDISAANITATGTIAVGPSYLNNQGVLVVQGPSGNNNNVTISGQGGAGSNPLIQFPALASRSYIGYGTSGGTGVLRISSTGHFTFGSDTDTGQVLQVAGDGYFSGNVGIGSTSPTAKLVVSSGANNDVAIGQNSSFTGFNVISLNGVRSDPGMIGLTAGGTGDTNLYLSAATGGSFIFRPNGTTGGGTTNGVILGPTQSTFMNGNVGIGTSSPYAALSVAGATGVVANQFYATSTTATSTFAGGLDVGNGALRYDFTSGATSISNLELGNMTFDADSGVVNWADMPVTSASSNGTIESYTAGLNGNPMITVFGKSDGAGGVTNLGVGIGTTTPGDSLDVYQSSGSFGGIRIENGGTGGGKYSLYTTNNSNPNGGNKFGIYDQTTGLYRLTVDGSGNVGIGTTSPTQALTVAANAFVNLRLSVGADINNNYNVLINSTSTSNIGSELNVQSSGLGGLSLSNRGVNDESIGFDSDYVPGTSLPIARGTSAAIIRKNSSTLTFEGRSSGIFLGSSYTPSVFATWDLGTGDLTTTGKITPGGDFQIGDNLIKFHDLTTNQTISSNSTYFGGPAIDIHSANGVSMETNSGQMVMTSAGNVGIGTTSPNIDGYSASARVLTLSSLSNSILELNTTAADASGNRPGEIAFEASVGQSGSADKRIASILSETEGTGANNRGGNLRFSTKGNNSSVFERMRITSAGLVGIGSTTPYAKLSIKGDDALSSTINFQATNNSDTPLFTVQDSGFVGIGSATASHLFTIQGDNANPGVNDNNGQFVIRGSTDINKRLTIGYQTTANYGWLQAGQNGGGNNAFVLNPSGGSIGIGTTSPTALLGLQGAIGVSSNQLYLASGGNVGIGTVGPTSALQVTADHANEGSDHASQIMATGATDPNMRLMLGYDTTDNNGYIQSFWHHNGPTTLALQTQGGGVGIGTTSAPSTLTVTGSACFSQGAGVGTVLCGNTAGNIYYKTANTGNYDVAENYTTTDITVNAGDIVKLDTSASAYSITKAQSGDQIFGVVSTNPGVVLGGADASTADATTTRPVALSGRVPVKVDGENGAIAVGDPITVSSVPGVGMKALGSEEQIGVALQAWNGAATDEGTIQVFVSQKQRVDASQFTIAPNGNIGIGSTSPMYKLSVAGDVAAISFVNVSTRTAKTDISYLDDTAKTSILDTINGMNIATYRYKTEDPNDPLRLGLIAEEAPKQVLAVGGKGVDIYKLATFTLAGVQMQQKQINSLQNAQASTTAGMTTLSSGLSDTVLTVSSTTKAFADAQVTIFDLVGLTKEQGDAIAAIQTRLDTLAAQVGALGTTTASLQASLATLQAEVAALQAGQSGTSSTATTSVATSATAAELASSTPFIQSVASAVQSSIAAVGEWTVSKLSASIIYADRVEAKTVAVTQGFDITDQATGTVWCVTIKNGDWTKVPWSCETPSQNVAAAAGTQGATYTEPITQSSTLNVTQTDIAAPSASTTTTSVATTTTTTTSTATTTASVTDTTATTTASTATTTTATTTDSTSTATSSPSVTTTDTSGSTATSTTTTSTATTTASVTDTTATTTTSTATTTTP